MPISNQKEEIDSRILRLIGLDDIFDLDYETYLTLLKEAMVKGRMAKTTIPTEEVELLTNEYKRVKGKKDQGRFSVKKKKISASSFKIGNINEKILKSPFDIDNVKRNIVGKSSVKELLPPQAISKSSGISPITKIESNISAITSAIVSISETLKQQQKITNDNSAYNRRKAEQEKRGLVESKLEKRFEGLKKVAEKIIAPVKSLLDRIIEFFTTIILGRIVYKLVEWLGDPKNASKVKSIIRFVKDWWPALLGSYILFGTSFGRLTLGLTKMVGGFIFQLGKVAIPKLLSVIAKNPLASLIVGTSVAGTLARTGERERLKPELDKQRASVEKTEKDANAPWYQKLGASFAKQELTTGQQNQSIVAPVPGAMFSGGGLASGFVSGERGVAPVPGAMFSGGGLASGFVSGERGVDKVPAMLSDGEFVMSRGAVAKYGVDTLEGMNAAGGGTNKPKIMNRTTYAAGGGLIGSERYDLTTGLRGESSKSDIYLVRAVNELIKVLRNKFPDSGSSGSSGVPDSGSSGSSGVPDSGSSGSSGVPDSGSSGSSGGSSLPKQLANIANEITSRGSQIYQGASAIANRGYSLASRAAGAAAEKAKPTIQSLPATMDYGSLYLRSQLGGLGGSITEADLSNQTQNEYKKAFARAKADSANRAAGAQSVVNQYQQLLKGPNLTADQKKDFNNKLASAKGELAKYKKGLVNVEYSDFKDEKGRLSPSAEAAQKTLGAVWASQEKDGGIKIAKEPYDFPLIKDPIGLMRWKTLSKEEKLSWLDKQNPSSAVKIKLDPRNGGSFGKWGKQDIAEAMYTLNPFATPVETDVKIGGKPRPKGILDKVTNMLDNPLLSMGRGLGMNLLKGKERNVVTGEAEKGSFLDKLFPKKESPLPKPGQTSGSVTMYKPNDPRRTQSGAYKSRFARPKNVGVKPVNPPIKPSPKVVKISSQGGSGGSSSKPSTSKPPSFSASTNGMRSKQETLGMMR